MSTRFLAVTVLAVAVLAAASPTVAAVNGTPTPRTITVTGSGEVKAKPDLAMISTGVETNAATASEALSKNSAAMTRIFAALKKAGIADEDMQTSNFSVSPQYNTNDREPRR